MADETKRDTPFDMAGLIEKTFMLGIGMLEMTREKTNELAEDLIERGKMSQSEAKNVAERIGDMAEKQQEVMRDTVTKETDRAMKNAGFATKADVDSLRAEIAELKLLLAGGTPTAEPSSAPDPSINPDE